MEALADYATGWWAARSVFSPSLAGRLFSLVMGPFASLATPPNAWKTELVLSLGMIAGLYSGRPYWQYYPAENPSYKSPWLTRGWTY